ncbi:hypothetical protein EJ065_2202 [Corallococcus coralloides]|uniref:AAA+ ATPase domain-containing protein n=1 Tax=Corallococcus coralloides TaxID=184914 RepID=A0A410RPL1_CORCK|nr:AAA family ATPase [Corallococcus coralloides]QAT83785.1 hypothetical protein EJ065_2202 [Corallococcus coralloides]
MHFESEQWLEVASFQKLPCVFLEGGEPWNDNNYATRFTVYFVERPGEPIRLGFVKILKRGEMKTTLPGEFSRLDDSYCSLGQSVDFYERVQQLGHSVAREVLLGLRDVVLTPTLQEAFKDEPAYSESLLRASSAHLVLKEAGRFFHYSSTPLPPPSFTYKAKFYDFAAPHELRFDFHAREKWLGRIVALVGRNGMGKTVLLGQLANELSGFPLKDSGKFTPEKPAVSQVLAISYSPFDTFKRPKRQPGVNYVYCGLRDSSDRVDPQWAVSEFDLALGDIRKLERWSLWMRLMQESGILNELPDQEQLFVEQPVAELARLTRQSSGHKVVLLILARVFASIQPRSILLFDEPETHLHPHLLSGLMRLLHLLLHEFDSYAIVATHSPIVLQELPARDIQILECEGGIPIVSAYPGESFGNNLTEIVNMAFRVSEKDKNYFKILEDLILKQKALDAVAALFDEQLNLNMRMTLRALMKQREGSGDDES